MKHEKSRELHEQSKRFLAGGVSSNARITELPGPMFFDRGKGSKLYDVDGNELIDYVMGRGPIIFGHSPDFLIDAVAEAMTSGLIFAGQHRMEITVSELVQEIVPCADLVRYTSTGTEAVQLALRLARAYTNRPKYIKFNDQFHGWADSVYYIMSEDQPEGADGLPVPKPWAGGLTPGSAEEVIPLPINDLDILVKALDSHPNEVAAIISSPVPHHVVVQPGFFEEVRRICDERGVLLIFDEVVTGFRLAPGGGQECLGVTPDLATFAKAMANGFPVAMVAGKRDVMGLLEDNTVMHGGTLNSNVMCMAAVEACIQKLTENDGAVYKHLYGAGETLAKGLKESSARHGVELDVIGPGPFIDVFFQEDAKTTGYEWLKQNQEHCLYDIFCMGMLERGIRLMKGGAQGGSWFLSTAHSDEDVEKTLTAADQTLADMSAR